jgi:hypothetical protein
MSRRYIPALLIILCGFALFSLAANSGPAETNYSIEAVGTRPTPVRRPTPEPPPPGGFIELRVAPLQENLWTEIQWRGVGDAWHDVDGWRGTPDEAGVVRWYVGPEHLGEGPFRWLVYDGMDGPLLGVSAPFDLPEQARQVVVVTVDLAEQPE